MPMMMAMLVEQPSTVKAHGYQRHTILQTQAIYKQEEK